MQNSPESASKVSVEDGIYDRVKCAVDISKPNARRHDARVDSTRALTVVELVRVAGRHVANADGIDDVDRKERRPAQQKHRYKRTHVQQTVIFHFNYNI